MHLTHHHQKMIQKLPDHHHSDRSGNESHKETDLDYPEHSSTKMEFDSSTRAGASVSTQGSSRSAAFRTGLLPSPWNTALHGEPCPLRLRHRHSEDARSQSATEKPAAGFINYNFACSKRCMNVLKFNSSLSRDAKKGSSSSGKDQVPLTCARCYQLLVEAWAKEIFYLKAPLRNSKISAEGRRDAKAKLESAKSERNRELRAFDPCRPRVERSCSTIVEEKGKAKGKAREDGKGR